MRALPFVLAASFVIACAPPRDRAIRLERLAAERRNMERTLDRLEARLTATQARVRFWEELRARHESVSAISCASQLEHAEDMARHLRPDPSSLHRARVAAVASERAPVRTPAAVSAPAVPAVPTRIRN